MKLLLDGKLLRRLATSLGEFFPDSRHVAEVDLAAGPDEEVWEYAKASWFTLVSKDSDFQQPSFVRGHPPKMIWIRLGNCAAEARPGRSHYDPSRYCYGRGPEPRLRA